MQRPTPRRASGQGELSGLAYELWLPDSSPPWGGMLIPHGAGSRKENHADFARLASSSGWVALAYDQRGHGASGGEMGPPAVADVGRMARFLASVEGVDPHRICVRGSSLGGFIAIHAAAASAQIGGAIAICPPSERQLLRGLQRGWPGMRADREALEPWLEEHEVAAAVQLMGKKPLLLLHARGDDEVPWTHSRELFERAAEPRKLIVVPGGHHRSVQHDPELQGAALRWLERALRA